MSLFGDMKKAFRRIGRLDNDFRNLFRRVEDLPGQIRRDIEREVVEPVKRELQGGIDDVGRRVGDIAGSIEEAAEAAAHRVIAEITSEASQQILETMLRVVRVAAPSGVSFELGPLSLSIDDIHERIDHLVRYAESGIPSDREGIKQAILDFAPSSLTVSLSVNVALVVVNIDELGVGMSATWNAEDILENIDDVLDCLGI